MRILPVIAAVALAASLSACTSNSATTDSSSTSAGASSTAAKGKAPLEPVRHEVKKGPGYEVTVPSAWTEAVMSSSKLTTKPVRWMQPGSEASPIFAGVTIDDQRKNDAEGQSTFMEKTADVTGKKNLKRTRVDWVGAKDAYLIEWDEELGEGTSHVMQLMAQLDSGDIVNVVGRAPADQFDKLNIRGIVDSLKLKG